MVNNSVLQSTLALISTQSFYNERARMGHGDLPLSIVTPSTLGQLNLSQRAMRPCQAVSNVGMDVSITDDALTVPTAQVVPLLLGRQPQESSFLLQVGLRLLPTLQRKEGSSF